MSKSYICTINLVVNHEALLDAFKVFQLSPYITEMIIFRDNLIKRHKYDIQLLKELSLNKQLNNVY